MGGTRFLWPAWLTGITGAASLSGTTDTDDLFLAGTDGQLYQLQGSGDRASPGAAAQPVAFTFASRGLGQGSGGPGYYRTNIAERVYVEAATSGGPSPLTIDVTAAGGQSDFTATYTFDGRRAPRLPVKRAVRGGWMTVRVSGATVSPVRLTSCAIETIEGGFDE